MPTSAIQNYFQELYNAQGNNGFVHLLNDFLRPSDMCVPVMTDLGVEEQLESYWDELEQKDRNKILAANNGMRPFEVIISTDYDELAIFLVGTDEERTLNDLRSRYNNLMTCVAKE